MDSKVKVTEMFASGGKPTVRRRLLCYHYECTKNYYNVLFCSMQCNSKMIDTLVY